MKAYKVAKKYASKIVLTGSALASSAMVHAAEDADVIAAVSTGMTDAGDTSKGVYLLALAAMVVVIGVLWGISALRSVKKG